MKLPRRNFLHLAVAAAALPAVSHVARAQAYPSRPVRIIVGFPAGGPGDVTARLIGQWVSERLRQPFVIETSQARLTISPPRRSCVRPPMATHFFTLQEITQSMRHFTTSSISISFAI